MANEQFDPVREFVQLRDNLGRAVERGIRTVTGPVGFPAVDIYEDSETLYIRSEPIVGLQPESLDISIEDNVLTITGETEDYLTEAKFLYREIHFGTFNRSIRLPRLIDAQATTANLKQGIVTIIMPKISHSDAKIVDGTPTS